MVMSHCSKVYSAAWTGWDLGGAQSKFVVLKIPVQSNYHTKISVVNMLEFTPIFVRNKVAKWTDFYSNIVGIEGPWWYIPTKAILK